MLRNMLWFILQVRIKQPDQLRGGTVDHRMNLEDSKEKW